MPVTKVVIVFLGFCLSLSQAASNSTKTLTFGALFESDDGIQRDAFKAAWEAVLSKKMLVPGTKLELLIESISSYGLETEKEVCELILSGAATVTVIFGPKSRVNAALVQSITGYLKIAHIEISKDNRQMHPESSSVNLHPHPLIMGKAYRDLINYFGWTKFVIIVEDNEGIVNNKEIFNMLDLKADHGIVLRQLPVRGDYTTLLKGLKTMSRRNMLIDCATEKIKNFLKQAQQLGMVTENYHYIFTSLDMDVLQLDEFRQSGVNITALRVVDPTTFLVSHVVTAFSKSKKNLTNNYTLTTEVALMSDAVFLAAQTVKPLIDNHFNLATNVSCNDTVNDDTTENNITTFMKQLKNFEGLTGPILLNENGLRVEFKLDVISLSETGLQTFEKIGNWSSIVKDQVFPGLTITAHRGKNQFVDEELPYKRHLNVTTLLNDPYVMLKQYWDRQTSGSIYQGFCIDLLDELASLLSFTYSLHPVKEKVYGTKNPVTGHWSGMIGELERGAADMAMADITITKGRSQAVDFSIPFLHHGLSIIYRKPNYDVMDITFLSPFSLEVWIYLLAAYLLVSILFCCFARLSKDEWHQCKAGKKDSGYLLNYFGISNSFWFTLGTFMQQGYHHKPRSFSPRLVATIWWGFSLAIVCFYVAASFNGFQKNLLGKEYPFTNINQLERSSTVHYGILKGGSTEAFFRNSNMSLYQRMWSAMQEMEPSPFVSSYKEGVARVRRGNYALFIEGPASEYVIEKYCDLYRVGDSLDYKGYGVAVPKGSPYAEIISQGILILHQKGTLDELKRKWWKHRNAKSECLDENQEIEAAIPLKPAYVKGLFYALWSVLLIALLTGVVEFVWRCYTISNNDQEPMFRVLRNEFHSALKPAPAVKENENDPSLVVNEEIIDDIE